MHISAQYAKVRVGTVHAAGELSPPPAANHNDEGRGIIMNESQKEQLKTAGVDLDGAMERFMGNEKLYENYLRKFTTGSHFQDLESALSQNDWAQALAISHNMKGVSGTLGFTRLFELLGSQVTMLRQDDNTSAAALMEEIMTEYRRLLGVAGNVI